MERSTKPLTTVARIFTVSTLLVAGGLFAVSGVAMVQLTDLSRHARATGAEVVSSRYLDHNQVDYKYVADGKTFTGTDHAGKGGNPNADLTMPAAMNRRINSSILSLTVIVNGHRYADTNGDCAPDPQGDNRHSTAMIQRRQ